MSGQAAFVLDASAAIPAFVAQVGSEESEKLLEFQAQGIVIFHVPSLFYVECSNALRRYVQAGQVTPSWAELRLIDFLDTPFRVSRQCDQTDDALKWSNKLSISAYDALYVALAYTLSVPFITGDARLIRAAGPYIKCISIHEAVNFIGQRKI